MKNILIIGSGVAGLSAAIYAKRSGFSVTLYEKHTASGGLSTSWKRGGYLFEGGMHWLTGSSNALSLNEIWKEVGALKENNPLIYRDPYYVLLMKEKERLPLYRNIERARKTFINYAPEDKKAIEKLFRDIKSFLPVHFIVKDIPFIKARIRHNPSLLELLKMSRSLFTYLKLNTMSYFKYLERFKNKNLRSLLASIIGYRYNAMSFIYTMASFASGDCGYPIGGSHVMIMNMLETFLELGGKVEYKKEVERVVSENKTVKGVIVEGKFQAFDAVIVTEDTRNAIDTLFEKGVLNEKIMSKMRRTIITEETIFISLGVKVTLKNYPRSIIFPLEKPFETSGLVFNELRINNYSLYPDHAPAGSTSLTCLLLGESHEYWKTQKENGTYNEKKTELANRFIEVLEGFIPEIAGKVEIIDVATPLTFERYCNCYHGSWMSVLSPDSPARAVPIKSVSIRNLYFAGQRNLLPGGLPCAVESGRRAVQYLCRDNKTEFVSQ